jgi:hypothetical protein
MKNLLKLSMILVAVSMIVFTTSCEKDKTTTTDPTPTVAKFTFLSAGHQWNYVMGQGTTTFDTMNITTISSLGAGKYQMSMDGDTNVWYQNENVFAFYDYSDTQMNIICKTDAKLNDVYTSVFGQDTSISKVVGLGVSVTVAPGTYSCYKVEQYSGSQLDGTFFISKESGIIKYEMPDGSYIKLINKNF